MSHGEDVAKGAGTARAAAYALTATALAALAAWLGAGAWRTSALHHALAEMAATVLAFVIGAVALTRYYSRKEPLLLLYGAGFGGTALLDTYHMLLAAGAAREAADGLRAVTAWSWFASRTLLALLFVAGAALAAGRGWMRTVHRRSERATYLTVELAALAVLLACILLPLPAYVHDFGPLRRPWELVPGALFLIALIGFLRGGWQRNALMHYTVLSLILATAGQLGFMAFSASTHDAYYDIAHYLKLGSYACVLLGLMMSVYYTYRQSDARRLELAHANRALGEEVRFRTRAERALVEAKAQAEAANQAKSEFLANMSHELRTPLNSVIGFTNVLLKNKEANLAEQQRTYLERIRANGEHLLGLINDILDLSKIEAQRLEVQLTEVDLAALLRETAAALEGRTIDRPVELRVELPERVAPATTDAGKLKQVVINLVGNALKFTESGSVRLVLESDPATGRPSRIQVADTGPGIAADKLPTIFDPFVQVDGSMTRKHAGTGLGLAISRRLCEMLGYELRVESEVGVGSTFTIEMRDGARA